MRFASLKQIVGLTVAWALVLFSADYLKNPRPIAEMFGGRRGSAAHPSRPHLSIWMNHLCCSGCLGDVQQALAVLPGLGPADLAQQPQKMPSPESVDSSASVVDNPANRLEVDVTDTKLVDFVAIDHALEKTGLVAERVEFGGVQHFRVVAELRHLCCQACVRGLELGLNIAKSLRATGQFGWIDSVTVSKEHHSLIVHARYDKTVDVEELIAALHRIGFAPTSVRILTGSET
jgi:hypothetical protein